jgi:hypothetical protein
MIKLSLNLKDKVNLTRWRKEFDPTDKDNLEELAVNKHIMFFMLYYKSKEYDDICL